MDKVLLHPLWGGPFFLLVMYVTFLGTFSLGEPMTRIMEKAFQILTAALLSHWPGFLPEWMKSLVTEGMLPGMAGVLVFLPNILLLFSAIAFLEESGIMARAVFQMDRLMKKLKLHGQSFVPMLVGFGCSVPGILATRSLPHRRDRLAIMMVVPLMSCGGRLTIYSLLIPAFFPLHMRAPVLWVIYVLGILLALGIARLLRGTLLAGEIEATPVELPIYRRPTWRVIRSNAWAMGSSYVRKVGTVVLGVSCVMWALSHYPRPRGEKVWNHGLRQSQEALAASVAGRAGRALEWVVKPLGFDHRIVLSLIGGLGAKELFVSQMAVAFAVEESSLSSVETLRAQIRGAYPPLVGFCVMVFCLIGMPCLATIAATRAEAKSWKWAVFQFIGLTAVAYVVSLLIYQGGQLLGIGTTIVG